jgi:quercetin dioxygenase-like cupin family protein
LTGAIRDPRIAASPREEVMMRWTMMVLFAALTACHALAQPAAPAVIGADGVRWTSPAGLPGVHGAWFLGAQDKPGPYLFRVRLAAGARIPPHTHPDERSTTVIRGTILVGFGETFEESRMVAVPAGSVYVAPAGLPHYLWARDGEAVYQESGIGPSATSMIRK